MSFRPLILAAAAAAALASTPTFAHPTQTTRVSYADLNLATPYGQAELQKRLDKAAMRVCGFGTAADADAVRDCYVESRKATAVHMAEAVSNQRLGG